MRYRTLGQLVLTGLLGASFLCLGANARPAFAQTGSSEQPDDAPRELSGTLKQSSAPAEPVQLGAPIPIEISIVHEPQVDVILPSSFASGRWELLDSASQTTEGETEWTTTLSLKLAVFRPGQTTLEPFPIELMSADGEGVLMSEPISVKAVSSLENDDVAFSAPRPPAMVWVEDNTLFWVGGSGALALILGLFFFAAHRRREDEIVIAPPRPAHEVALEKLGRLAGDDMVERGEHMVFYVLLSEAIREYLGRRYGFKAVEMTTTEILDALDNAKMKWPDALSLEDVAAFLAHCDSVKFGGFVPSADTASEKLRRAFTIVETTRPTGLPVSSESPASQQGDTPQSQTEEVDEDPDARWRPQAESLDTANAQTEPSTSDIDEPIATNDEDEQGLPGMEVKDGE